MGVDYLICNNGRDHGYPDNSEDAVMCDCGASFCDKNYCGKLDNYKEMTEEDYDIEEELGYADELHRIDKTLPITCRLCRKEKINDNVLLNALLKHFLLTREQAIKIYLEQSDE